MEDVNVCSFSYEIVRNAYLEPRRFRRSKSEKSSVVFFWLLGGGGYLFSIERCELTKWPMTYESYKEKPLSNNNIYKCPCRYLLVFLDLSPKWPCLLSHSFSSFVFNTYDRVSSLQFISFDSLNFLLNRLFSSHVTQKQTQLSCKWHNLQLQFAISQ